MKINNLNVNTAAISEGLYRIICQQGQEAIVAFGMIPIEIINMLEKLLREKIISISAAQNGCTVKELMASGLVSEQLIKDTMAPIVREVTTGIYTAASNAGKMVV
jgi:hypothetical protein